MTDVSTEDYLAHIDAQRWPSIAAVAPLRFGQRRGERALREVITRCERYGLDVLVDADPHADPEALALAGEADVVIAHPENLARRLVEHQALGLAEGYMAGEWAALRPDDVIAAQLPRPKDAPRRLGLRGVTSRRRSTRRDTTSEIPADLVSLYAGDTLSTAAGLFASGARTSVRQPLGGKGSRLVEELQIAAPTGEPSRADLPLAARRAMEQLLDSSGVRAGDRVLITPADGGELALLAADRGADVDVLTLDGDQRAVVERRVIDAGLAGAVRVTEVDHLPLRPREWPYVYDHILINERLETYRREQQAAVLAAYARHLDRGGSLSLQLVCRTPGAGAGLEAAVEFERLYVWPDYDPPLLTELAGAVEELSGLVRVSQAAFPTHHDLTAELWRDRFRAHAREAAAAGFDKVYRRMWDYHLSLLQALLRTDTVTTQQVVFRKR